MTLDRLLRSSKPSDRHGLHELQLRLVKVARERPGLMVGDLAGVLGVSGQLANYHVRALQQRGKVRTERRRLSMVVFSAATDGPRTGQLRRLSIHRGSASAATAKPRATFRRENS